MNNYLIFCLFSAVASAILVVLKHFLESIADTITFCKKTSIFNFKANELLVHLLNIQESKNSIVECLTVIVGGILYLVGSYAFLSGELRLIPLLIMIVSYIISNKF